MDPVEALGWMLYEFFSCIIIDFILVLNFVFGVMMFLSFLWS
jgi:hypothetical protein